MAILRGGLKKFEPREELLLDDGDVVMIIDVGPESLTVRSRGSRHEYTPQNLPAAIARLVAKAGANEDAPVAKVFWGAFEVTDPAGDRRRAEQLWRSAADAGESVDELLDFLRPEALAIEREDVPAAAAIADAEKSQQAAIAQMVESARQDSVEGTVCDQMISASANAADEVGQYIWLRAACRQAIAVTDVDALCSAVDEMAALVRSRFVETQIARP